MKQQESYEKCPIPYPGWKKNAPTLPKQTVTDQLRQQIHDSQFHQISSLKGESVCMCTHLFLQLVPNEKKARTGVLSAASLTWDTCSLQSGFRSSTAKQRVSGNCFIYRGHFCSVPWICRLASDTGASLKNPETLSLKSYILILVSIRSQSFLINSPHSFAEAKQN